MGGRPAWTLLVGPPVGFLYLATKRVRGAPQRVTIRHADPTAGAVGGAPYGATSVRRMCRHRQVDATRTLPLGLPLELPQGPRNL